MKGFVFISLFNIFFFTGFSQQVIFVATNGSDLTGDGSYETPYLTANYALQQVSDNDSVVLRGGTYPVEEEIRIDNDNITICSYPGEWAVLQAPVDNEDISSCIWYHDPEIIGGKLERLEIIGGYYYGIKFESDWNWGGPIPDRHGVSNITVKSCIVHDTGRDCFKITPACDNITIESCNIYNSGIGPANAGDPNAEGIDCVNADNLTVRNSYIHNTSTTGIYAKGGSINSLIENNLIIDAGANGILLGFYTDQEWFDTIANPDYYESLNGVVRNNIIIGAQYDGIGMYAAYQPKIYNNTVINAGQEDHAALFFNTGYIWIDEIEDMISPPTSDVYVVNNIFSVDETSDRPVAQIRYVDDNENSNMLGTCIVDYNMYFKTGGAEFDDGIDWQTLTFEQWKTSTSFDENSFEDDPELDGNYHLTEGSPCIDNAVFIDDLAHDYDGGNRTEPFDIGADEYGAGDILEIPPTGIGTGNGTLVDILYPTIKEAQLNCFPNPSSGIIQLECKLTTGGIVSLVLYDIKGLAVKEVFSGFLSAGNKAFNIQTDGLETGVYSIRLETSKNISSKNIVIIGK